VVLTRVQRVQMERVLPWLDRWVRRAGPRWLLSCLGCSGQLSTKYFFTHRTQFQFMCPHRLATWAGSRAGPPVSECVSPPFWLLEVGGVRGRRLKGFSTIKKNRG
jgi:hypothetical protein